MGNMNVQGVVNSYSIIIILGLAILLGAIWWGKSLVKKNPDVTFGDIVNAMFYREKVTIFLITLGCINFAEALFAASITPKGEIPVNPLARIVSHMIIAIVAITCGLMLPTIFKQVFAKENKRRGAAISILVLAVFGTFALPYMNLILIASGLKQIPIINLYMYSLNPFNSMPAYYKSIGLSPVFSPLQALEYPMVVTVFMTFSHYFVVLLDGMFIIYNEKIDKKEGNKEGNKDKDKQDNKRGTTDPISKLIQRYFNGTVNKDVEKHWIDKCHDIHDKLSDSHKSNLSSEIISYVSDIEKFDIEAKSMDTDERAEAKKALRIKIMEFVKTTPKYGKGFGLTLPKIDMGN